MTVLSPEGRGGRERVPRFDLCLHPRIGIPIYDARITYIIIIYMIFMQPKDAGEKKNCTCEHRDTAVELILCYYYYYTRIG